MPEENFIERKEENLSIQIFAVSAAMVGVCLTVIGADKHKLCSKENRDPGG